MEIKLFPKLLKDLLPIFLRPMAHGMTGAKMNRDDRFRRAFKRVVDTLRSVIFAVNSWIGCFDTDYTQSPPKLAITLDTVPLFLWLVQSFIQQNAAAFDRKSN